MCGAGFHPGGAGNHFGTHSYFYRKGGSQGNGGTRIANDAASGDALRSIKLGLLTCQDFTNGYYGALAHVAKDDSLDFVLHLGDFIYESAGDPRFQSLPFADRSVVLPSGGIVALDLADYRAIYRRYRRGRPMYALVSASKDGAWLDAFFSLIGRQTVRGTSNKLGREAATALEAARIASHPRPPRAVPAKNPVPYPQGREPFTPYMSFVDALMNAPQ